MGVVCIVFGVCGFWCVVFVGVVVDVLFGYGSVFFGVGVFILEVVLWGFEGVDFRCLCCFVLCCVFCGICCC